MASCSALVSKKDNVLAIPSSAIIFENNKQFVRVVDNPKTKSFHRVEVTSGLQADGGLVEILSGLNASQEIITYQK